MKLRSGIAVCVLLLAPALAQNDPAMPQFSCEAERLSASIGVREPIARLYTAPADLVTALVLRQTVSDQILESSLTVDVVLARIEQERAGVQELNQFFEKRRTRQTWFLNLSQSVLGGTMQSASSAEQLVGNNTTAYVIGIVSGGISTTLGALFAALKGPDNQAGGGIPPAAVVPSEHMLADFLAPSSSPPAGYPMFVWQFLTNEPGPECADNVSVRQMLIRSWEETGYLGGKNAEKSQQKLDALVAHYSPLRPVRRSVLSDRAAMLADLHARVAGLKILLRELLQTARRPALPPAETR